MKINKDRRDNLFWTVSENYLARGYEIFNPDSFYQVCLLGYAFKKYQMDYFVDFARSTFLKFNNKDDFLCLAFLTLDKNLKEELFKERPGLISIRKNYCDEIFKTLTFTRNTSFAHELTLSYFQFERGIYPKAHKNIVEILNLIFKSSIKDVNELMDFLSGIYLKYFHLDKTLSKEKIEDTKEKIKSRKTLGLKTSSKSNSQFLKDYELEKFNIGSSEFFEENYENLKLVKDKKDGSAGNEDFLSVIEKNYGQLSLGKNQIQKLENNISKGIHSNIKIYWTKGQFKEDTYYKEISLEKFKENYSEFEKNKLKYLRGIRNLREVIKNSLLKESEEYSLYSKSGSLEVSKLWKINYIEDPKVFKKNFIDDKGQITVDILLDSSASQNEREAQVAIQAYIISSALCQLKIKNRVLAFNNLFNYLTIREYRNYNDDISKNKDIFSYQARGSNRDGLAIKLMNYLIDKNKEDRKFLIVLSDGRPNDEVNLAMLGRKKLDVRDYTDDFALYDTSKEVLNAKLKGINVLGVFTGNPEDLPKEKIIYGNDFAYITKLNRFSQIVGLFFKSMANKLN